MKQLMCSSELQLLASVYGHKTMFLIFQHATGEILFTAVN